MRTIKDSKSITPGASIKTVYDRFTGQRKSRRARIPGGQQPVPWREKPDRWNEFELLLKLLVAEAGARYRGELGHSDVVLFGDLSDQYNKLQVYREKVATLLGAILPELKDETGARLTARYPFLDIHPNRDTVFATNTRGSGIYSHVGFLGYDQRLGAQVDTRKAGFKSDGFDFGTFDFVELIARALREEVQAETQTRDARLGLLRSYHIDVDVSYHLPVWARLPMPD